MLMDEAGNPIYLGMVGHKTVLESIRATVQVNSRSLEARRRMPLPGQSTHGLLPRPKLAQRSPAGREKENSLTHATPARYVTRTATWEKNNITRAMRTACPPSRTTARLSGIIRLAEFHRHRGFFAPSADE